MKRFTENTRGGEGFWLNRPNKALGQGRPGDETVPEARRKRRKFDQIPRSYRCDYKTVSILKSNRKGGVLQAEISRIFGGEPEQAGGNVASGSDRKGSGCAQLIPRRN